MLTEDVQHLSQQEQRIRVARLPLKESTQQHLCFRISPQSDCTDSLQEVGFRVSSPGLRTKIPEDVIRTRELL